MESRKGFVSTAVSFLLPSRAAFTLAAISMLAVGPLAAMDVPDEPAPVFDTGVHMATHTGKMLWLSNRTLAVTAGGSYEDGKVVAIDVTTRTQTVLVDPGYLNCASATEGMVSILKGSLVRMFWGEVKAKGVPDPVSMLYRWDDGRARLVDERPAAGSSWNPNICSRTASQDMGELGISFSRRGDRYLQPDDGRLQWELYGPDADQGKQNVFLVKPGRSPMRVDVRPTEAGFVPVYQPALKRYVLTGGYLTLGGATFTRPPNNESFTEQPAVVMSKDGRVTRLPVPDDLQKHLETLGASNAETFPVADGLLLHAGGWKKSGAGLYKVVRGAASRIWCNADNYGEKCSVKALEVSPDGCHVAFVPQEYAQDTVQIISLCRAR